MDDWPGAELLDLRAFERLRRGPGIAHVHGAARAQRDPAALADALTRPTLQ